MPSWLGQTAIESRDRGLILHNLEFWQFWLRLGKRMWRLKLDLSCSGPLGPLCPAYLKPSKPLQCSLPVLPPHLLSHSFPGFFAAAAVSSSGPAGLCSQLPVLFYLKLSPFPTPVFPALPPWDHGQPRRQRSRHLLHANLDLTPFQHCMISGTCLYLL